MTIDSSVVAHAVTNDGSDRTQPVPMGLLAQEATGCATLTVLADRGYLNGDQVLACEGTGLLPCVPKTLTSGHAKLGLFTGLHLRRREGHPTPKLAAAS